MSGSEGSLFAISDLHTAYPENRKIVNCLRPEHDEDWLIVAGDVGERMADIASALTTLSRRFAKVIWAPGNHELWTPREDPPQLRGRARYEHLVALCRGLGVLTPEDPYAVWRGAGGPVTVAPLFVLYDYSFRAPGTTTKRESLAAAYDQGIVCSDEFLLHPDPYPTRDAWCRARLAETERRLESRDPGLPTVLVNHWPLLRQNTDLLYHQEFAQWCGTVRTADWHRRFRALSVVYGHLHIPRTTWHDGVRFEEVSVGYPREWRRPGHPRTGLRRILPYPGAVAVAAPNPVRAERA
ncbi:metallophosphoesterase family protein [Streptomyces sp. NPDC057381]|uniref:metallophosphoesterase family protein n=1 Tax=unclassified Streptomyces TaxID=2593676 RepID=UPI0036427AB8